MTDQAEQGGREASRQVPAAEVPQSAGSARGTANLNEFLVRFADAAGRLTDPEAVANTACQMIHAQLGVERAYWAEVDSTTREYVIMGGAHSPGVPTVEGRFPMDDWEPFTSAHRERRSHVVEDTQTDPRISASMKAGYAHLGVGADLASPAVVNGELRSVLAVNQRAARHWTDEDVALVEAAANRCWAEVERAKAEAALRKSEEKYRSLFERMDEGFALCELVRGASGRGIDYRYVELNFALVRHGNISPDALVGRRAS